MHGCCTGYTRFNSRTGTRNPFFPRDFYQQNSYWMLLKWDVRLMVPFTIAFAGLVKYPTHGLMYKMLWSLQVLLIPLKTPYINPCLRGLLFMPTQLSADSIFHTYRKTEEKMLEIHWQLMLEIRWKLIHENDDKTHEFCSWKSVGTLQWVNIVDRSVYLYRYSVCRHIGLSVLHIISIFVCTN